MTQSIKDAFTTLKTKISEYKKTIFWLLGSFFLITIIIVSSIATYVYLYTSTIYPNISVAGISLKGLTRNEARDVLQSRFDNMLDEGLTLTLNGKNETLDLQTSGSSNADLIFNLIDFDAGAIADSAISIGHNGKWYTQIQESLSLLAFPIEIPTNTVLLEDELAQTIHEAFSEIENQGEITTFDIEIAKDDKITINTITGTEGTQIDTNAVITSVKSDMYDLKLSPITLNIIPTNTVISETETKTLHNVINAFLDNAPYTLTHSSDSGITSTWDISNSQLAEWLIPIRKEGTTDIALNKELVVPFLEEIADEINIDPQNARFTMEDGKVSEFAGSHKGVEMDIEATMAELEAKLGTEQNEIAIKTLIVDPEITTSSVNDLGIREILGVGVSDFSGSPWNRIQNIKHGASKLNGLLIAPDETVSLVDQLKPFTVADGYLPELVIKGDEIKKEVGGGLCQIGTTTFRSAMNSGLDIVERRNHSLVVSYYDDSRNGKPGTDATIYDPSPDFKFRNDTENYILLTTDVNTNNNQLTFTFWGTSDGREAYYTPPEVLSWSGYGATQYKDTTTLAPGVTRCQSPHPGATTSFDYTVTYANGEVFEENYTSVYRSLPKICLVGIDPDAKDEEIVESDSTKTSPSGSEDTGDAETSDTSSTSMERPE